MSLTTSESLFENFCTIHAIRYKRIDVEKNKTPDYDIFLNRFKIVTEVKEITPNKSELNAQNELKLTGFSSISLTPGDRVRKKISDAVPQIKSRSKGKYPGLLVLFDCGLCARHIDPYQIRVGMYGFETLKIAVPQNPTESPYAVGAQFGSKKKMTPEHNTSISAIATLTTPNNNQIQLEIFHNAYASIPINPKLFGRYGIRQYQLSRAKLGEIQQWEEIKL